jgi:hypothetical protein
LSSQQLQQSASSAVVSVNHKMQAPQPGANRHVFVGCRAWSSCNIASPDAQDSRTRFALTSPDV